MDKKQQIIETCLAMVISKKSCRFSMDQLAKELKMSKKTIYTHFSSKDELMEHCVIHVFKKMDEQTKQIILEESDIITLLHKKTEMIASQLQFMSNELIREIQQEYPRMWQLIEDMRALRLKENEAIFSRGIELGILKPIDPKIIVYMYQTCIKEITNQDFLIEHNITMSQACQLVKSIILEGILIEK